MTGSINNNSFFHNIMKICAMALWWILVVIGLMGCGGDDETLPRNFNPVSPLPPRVDAVVTPSAAATPGQTGQLQTAPSPEGTPSGKDTPTPTNSDNLKTPKTIAPTPTVTPTPDVASAESVDATPTPDTKKSSKLKATPTPDLTETPKDNAETPSQIEDLPPAEETQTPSDGESDGEQEPTKPPKSGPIKTPYGITIERLDVCSKLSNKSPNDPGETFSYAKSKKIFTWMKLTVTKPPRTLKHLYYHDGTLVATVKLDIKNSSMRTWSGKTLKRQEALGKWKVVITTDKDDEILAVKEFTIVP